MLKKWAETGPREGFQARTQSAYGRKIIKISSVVGAVPCFRPFFELANHAPGTRNRKAARLPAPLPEPNKSRGCAPPRSLCLSPHQYLLSNTLVDFFSLRGSSPRSTSLTTGVRPILFLKLVWISISRAYLLMDGLVSTNRVITRCV